MKVGPAAQAAFKPTEQNKPPPKKSFSEALAAQTEAARTPPPATTPATSPRRADPRAAELMDKLGMQLLTTTKGMAKEAKLEREEAKGGMEEDG